MAGARRPFLLPNIGIGNSVIHFENPPSIISMNSSSDSLTAVNTITSTGKVTRVCNKFAYVVSNHYGGVFVPISAAAPSDRYCPGDSNSGDSRLGTSWVDFLL